MYSTCIFCSSGLGSNQVIEPFPVGQRLAFDAAKGRLWVVCRRCERWNLSPLEERWEVVEECERRFRDTKKRVATDNVGLARLDDGLELVRIGEPLRPEFAAWRYGDQFGRRRRRSILLTSAATVAADGVVVGLGAVTGVVSGGGYGVYQVVEWALQQVRNRRVVARVPLERGGTLTVRGKHLDRARIVPAPEPDGRWALELTHAGGESRLLAHEAVHATGLVMAKINAAGASRTRIQRAVRRIEDAGDRDRFIQVAVNEAEAGRRESRWGGRSDAGTLRKLPLETRLAVEMAVNEETERIAMEGELALLELAWKEAEEIAAIADDLLVPPQVEEFIRRQRGT